MVVEPADDGQAHHVPVERDDSVEPVGLPGHTHGIDPHVRTVGHRQAAAACPSRYWATIPDSTSAHGVGSRPNVARAAESSSRYGRSRW